jgi:hypothetical protein
MDPITIREVLPVTIELGEKFIKLFQAVKKKLWGDKEKAFGKLKEVIDEILKFYEATHKEISNFMSLDFSNKKNEAANRESLYNILNGSLKVRISDAQGHCSRIGRIYENNLDKWLKKKLSNVEYLEMYNLFMSLSTYDDDMLFAATNLELDLQNKSKVLLDLLDAKNLKKAVEKQLANRKQFQPVQKRLSTVMEQLILLRNEFMEITDSD